VLGAHCFTYEQVKYHAECDGTPLYPKDVVKCDRQDDNAACRLFSSGMLKHISKDPGIEFDNIGLFIYLFVLGEFGDAIQNREMDHHTRVKIVIRTLLFLETWHLFLHKKVYWLSQHFISDDAYDIFKIIGNAYLASVIIYRNHLEKPCPLLPWHFGTEGAEHIFGDNRLLIPDFSVQQKLLLLARHYCLVKASHRAKYLQPNYKTQGRGYTHTYLSNDDTVNYENLSKFPTDKEFVDLMEEAAEERDAMWSALGIHPQQITDALFPPKNGDQQEHDDDEYDDVDDDVDADDDTPSAREHLQNAIRQLDEATGLNRADDEEVDTCTYAAVAQALGDWAKIQEQGDDISAETLAIQEHITAILTENVNVLRALFQKEMDNQPRKEQNDQHEIIRDVNSAELDPLVEIRSQNETYQAKVGIRTYRSEAVMDSRTKKPLTECQLLTQRLNSILHRSNRSSASGAARRIQTIDNGDVMEVGATESGNSANAALAASKQHKNMLKNCRQTFQKYLKNSPSYLGNAGVSNDGKLMRGTYGIILDGNTLMLGKVETIYSKTAGKNAAHAMIESTNTIGEPSNIGYQVFKREHGCSFKRDFPNALPMPHFSHLHSGSFLALLDSADITENLSFGKVTLKKGSSAEKMWTELDNLLEHGLAAAVKKLIAPKKRKGVSNEDLDIEEDDET
jgi:hypothetical protein